MPNPYSKWEYASEDGEDYSWEYEDEEEEAAPKSPRTSPKRRKPNPKRSQNQKNLPKWKDGPEPPFKPRDKLRKRKRRRSQ